MTLPQRFPTSSTNSRRGGCDFRVFSALAPPDSVQWSYRARKLGSVPLLLNPHYRICVPSFGLARRVAELQEMLPEAHFAGHQTGAKLARWYASADLLLVPSTTEPVSGQLLEAFASGLPAVVADAGGPPEWVCERLCGLVARPNDPADFADKVEQLLVTPSRLTRMSLRARRYAYLHEWSVVNDALLDSYDQVLAQVRVPQRRTA